MNFKKIIFPQEKRKLPLDKLIKNILRLIHVMSFSVFFGGLYFGIKEATAYAPIASISGLLMMFREIYKNGIWICQIRGILTFFKLGLLSISFFYTGYFFQVITLVAVIGVLCSHLPKTIRKKILIKIN
jgi:hypothetical protein